MDTSQLKTKLEERLTQLTVREKALSKHLRGQDGRLDQDFSDRVAYTEMDEVIERLDDDAKDEIKAIEAALRRIESESFGECAKCGDDIADKRLAILPHTTLCVSCAT